MAWFRWVLLLLGLVVLAGLFAYGRGWIPTRLDFSKWRRRQVKSEPAELPELAEHVEPVLEAEPEPEPEPEPVAPRMEDDSKIVTVRIMPRPGCQFPAEPMILALRDAGLKHGQFGIFHCQDDKDHSRTRYSIASLAEPGSFDLSKLKDSEYPGVSIFMVLPTPENGVELFDDMLTTARKIAAEMDGVLVDEQGGTLSVQRERYMREEVIEFQYLQSSRGMDFKQRHDYEQDASAAG